jgi:hypothetical protein
MAKRFSRLKYALALLKTPNSTDEPPDAPSGSVIRKYQLYKGGKVDLKYPRDASSKPEQLKEVSVLPFYFGGLVGTEAIVKQSKRADEAGTLQGVQTACNQIAVDIATHSVLAKFHPARATVFDYTGASTVATSQITGLKYDKRAGKSYTFPYGASAAEKTPASVEKTIIAAVKAITTASVGFVAERR